MDTRDSPLHVTVPAGATPPRLRGVRGHVTNRPVESLQINGIELTAPLRGWCDLAATWTTDDLVMLGDAIVAAQAPRRLEILTPASARFEQFARFQCVVRADQADLEAAALATLRAAADGWTGRRGRLKLMAAADMVRAGVDSPQETRTRLLVLRGGLPEPAVNLDIHDLDGTWLHRPDLSWPKWRVGIDYDGGHHFASERQVRRDQIRREDLRSVDWQLVVITKYDLYQRPGPTVRRLARALHHGGWRP
jgi:hypothetical protein